MITLDFETMPIDGNILINPPKPIGLAVKVNDCDPFYVTDWEEMRHNWVDMIQSEEELLFHNAPFDLSVGREWFGTEFPSWERIHDTQYLVFLENPHAPSLSLKPSAERILQWSIGDQDRLHEWILENISNATKKTAGAFIYLAPTPLVSEYAKDDVNITKALYDSLRSSLSDSMVEAYDVERELMPYLSEATVKGVRVDRKALQRAEIAGKRSLAHSELKIRQILGVDEINLNSGAELADALDGRGLVTEWRFTPTGKRSTAKDALIAGLEPGELLDHLLYSAALKKALSSFITPWLEQSRKDGRIHPNWNQTRTSRERDRGTRTGRLSSDNPNFQNISNPYSGPVPEGFTPIPELRKLILPEEGHVWVSRDYDAQEMRILAHFESGKLLQAFQDDPEMDPHEMVRELIKERTRMDLTRKQVKGVGFGIIYGMGAKSLGKQIGVSQEEAGKMRRAYLTALPGVATMQRLTKSMGSENSPIVTTGGREYSTESPKMVNNAQRTFEYKNLNYLIQGSAADQTKVALLRYFRYKPDDQVFMGTVHDQIDISMRGDDDDWFLVRCMESTNLDVPMRTTHSAGPTWGDLR